MQKKNTKNKKKLKESNKDVLKEIIKIYKPKPIKTEFICISEIIANKIVDKILTNVFNEIRVKNLNKFINLFCWNTFIKEITYLTTLSFVSHENDNNSDNEQLNIASPSPGKLDNWKIHRLHVVKYRKRKSPKAITRKNIVNKILSSTRIRMSKTTRSFGHGGGGEGGEMYDSIEKNKNKMKSLRNFDSFPSFPLPEALFKRETYLTKEQEKEIEVYRKEMKSMEENKKKQDQVKRRFAIFDASTHREENIANKNNKYKNKKIAVTAKGEIIFIKSIDVNNLKSDFIELSTKMKKESTKEKRLSKRNKKEKNDLQNEKEMEIEVNTNINIINIENKKKLNKQIIIGGSPFNNFIPETGVNLIENNETKSGGNDFDNKYKKISYEQFKKTLEKFEKANNDKNKINEIQKESENLSPNSNNNIMNSNIPIMRATSYNMSLNNNISDLKKTSERSSFLPDLFSSSNINSRNNNISLNNKNVNSKTFNDNDSLIKHSFIFKNNNSQMHNFIKTSSSFPKLILNEEKENKYENIKNKTILNKIINNPASTTTNFFRNFKRNFKIFSQKRHSLNSLTKAPNIYNDILANIDLGTMSQEQETNNINEKPKVNIVKKIRDKNILRVRSNLNEIYNKKMNILNKLTLRRNESYVNDYNKFKIEKIRKIINK